jgi:GDP-mannose 4,6 dehydratase
MRALICGIGGQDGGFLAKFLLGKGYEVYGTSRDVQLMSKHALNTLEIADRVILRSMAINDFRSVLTVLAEVKPDEVYNLAGQSSVGLSFEQPVETMESIAIGTLNLLEAIRFLNSSIRFYNAGSCECFGDTGDEAADEKTAFQPRSPYAVAKATAFWQVANYREAYKLHASSGILFNHESSVRPERFVTRKIVAAACRISLGSDEILTLGDIDIHRDWGWAPENERGLCEADKFNNLASFRNVDMNNIPENIGYFDFCWSSCAFEHLGSIRKGLDFVIQSARLLKPGGVAVHTTEYNVSSNAQTLDNNVSFVIFRRRDIELLVDELKSEGFEVEPIDFAAGEDELERYIDLPPYVDEPHLRLQLAGKYVSTSLGIIIRAPGIICK